MTITPYITLSGKAIHILSLDDLIDSVESGERLRAYCPIHGSDHQRSLSIDRTSGWGFCHCCHATVLVEAMNPMLVVNSAADRAHRKSTGAAYPLPFSLRSPVAQPARPATTTPDWQREEVAVLQAVLPFMREALASSRRAQRYLDERGIPLPISSASGVGYLPRAIWAQVSEPAAQHLFRRWI